MKNLVFLILIMLQVHAYAENEVNVKDLADIESNSDEIREQLRAAGEDSRGKTPLAALLLLREAIINRNWTLAANYVDSRYLSDDVASVGAPELIRRLSIIWQQQKIVDYTTLSDKPEGHLDDGLPGYRDLLGELTTSKGPVAVYLQRVPDGSNGKVWKISNATLESTPELWSEFGYPPNIEKLGNWLPNFTLMNMENWQFVAAIALIFISGFSVYIVTWLFSLLFKGDHPFPRICRRFITVGLRWFTFFKLLGLGLSNLGLSLKAKVWLTSGLLDYIATLFLLLGFLEIITAIYLAYVEKRGHLTTKAIIRPLSTTLKVLITLTMSLNWLSDAGFSITTLLTGLGIGSLAIALASQKMLENVFGAFTMYVARPISPGDFCKFGDVMGTVEEIGLRSTRIRTLDRKVVHVPNSEFSAKNLENISEIDRRHYRQELRLSLKTSAEDIRGVLVKLREILEQHERVMVVGRRVHFENIQTEALILVVNAYVDETSIVEFKIIAEDLNLKVLEVLEESGLELVAHQYSFLDLKEKSAK